MAERVRVLLLFGGRSAEHDVSRVSAVSVARALDPSRYDVVPVAITKDGHWLLAGEARAALQGARDALPAAFEVEGLPVAEIPDPGTRALVPLEGAAPPAHDMTFDVVLPLLHGPYGEDGTVQGLFELAGVPYVGSGVVGSAVAMDKVMMKRAFKAEGLPMPRWLAFRDGHDRDALVRDVEASFGYPCFVKPSNLGSSVGVSRAADATELRAALHLALSFDEWALVEEAIVGREIEVGILGDDPPEASVPGEIVPGDSFYSYADKYEDDAARLLAPAPLDPAHAEAVRELAIRAFNACRCEAMARVDFFLEENGRGFLVNEVNTIPGFTTISMYPRLWQESGVSFSHLLDRLIALAIARHERRERRAGRQRDG
ncbi:MAG: D-alanine--D-alanine ligase [Actinobacteria bacterium]|nr:D-alanine--D-alanine ligase [Actinomycetota bacterium]